MQDIKLLDVSLRDGGHRTNFHFSDAELTEILVPLDESGIDYIEIGYRNGSLHPIKNLGRAGFCDTSYLLFCQSLIKKARIAVMAHPGNIVEDDLQELKTCGVSLLRLCIARGGLERALPLIRLARQMNLPVSANFIHLSYYEERELDEVLEKVSACQPDMIYFADSNGSLLPASIATVYKKYVQTYRIPFGFHAHDNLGLAQANALAALSAGACLIDASLAGMGKGIGNLKTEFFTAWLHKINNKNYDLNAVLKAANFVKSKLGIGSEPVDMGEFTRGIHDLSTADLKVFLAKAALDIPV